MINTIDLQRGREILSYFHSESLHFSNYPFKSSLELENALGGQIFTDALGFTANGLMQDGLLNQSKMKSAMTRFADQAQGRLPAIKASFFKALSNEAQNVSFLDSAKYSAVQTTKDIAQGAEVVGQSVIAAGKGFFALLPVFLIGGVALFIYLRVKK